MFLLHETASGYALFEKLQSLDIAQDQLSIQQTNTDLSKFTKLLKLVSFAPFKSAAHALENIMDISEGVVSEHLKSFLELNLPKSKASPMIKLGIFEKNLAGAIKQEFPYLDCSSDETVAELIRGLRTFGEKMLKGFKDGDLGKAQLGLGHAYSRAKVKFNVHRSDNMIIQAISLLDQLDKDVNTFSMRCKEWYGWHFPELIKLVPDNAKYASCVKFIGDKNKLSDEHLEKLEEIVGDPLIAKSILDASRSSMGTDVSIIDLMNIESFANRVESLTLYRAKLYEYLSEKMSIVAPNLSALIGEVVGARLISHAGSLTNLAKYPASTVQILGAEKALFRALKTKGNTPKYGLIYHSSFISRASTKNKGRISRFLANKCSIASRIDHFIDSPTNKFGESLKGQVEERLAFFENGTTPSKNADVMKKVIDGLKSEEVVVAGGKRKAEVDVEESPKKKSKKEKKSKKSVTPETVVEEEPVVEKKKKSKKEKKEKKSKV